MIEVSNLTKDYDTVRALKSISFSVKRGEIVGFLGPNGAGKTTAMKILTCFMPQTSGSVKIDGHDVTQEPLAVRQKLGYLPESNALYREMMVYDYLRYVAAIRAVPPGEVDKRILSIAEKCGIRERLAQTIETLSKGLRQRVGLAQAMIHDPPILILDEPTSGLDPNQIVEIRNLIKELGQEHTIILSTHNLPEVMATCTRMIIVHNGEIVADGTPDELQKMEEENLSVRVVLAADSSDEVEEALKGLADVTDVTSVPTMREGLVGFDVIAPQQSDVQGAIFQLVVDKGWKLTELRTMVLDLERIFWKLTQEA